MSQELFMDGSRWILGVLLLVFGANGVLRFISVPPNPPEAERFRKALSETGYMVPVWKTIELVGAVLLLTNLWVPFALVILAPVLLNIFFFHAFLARKGLPLATWMVGNGLYLAYCHRQAFASLFR